MFDVEKVRRDFPILGVRVYDKPLVYLDSGATSQRPQAVLDAVRKFYEEDNANPHYRRIGDNELHLEYLF